MNIKKEMGTVSIEFAIGGFLFFAIVLSMFEFCYVVFISSVTDLAHTESVRLSRNQLAIGASSYDDIFKNYISNNNELWARFIDTEKFENKVDFYKDIHDLSSGTPATVADKSAIAVYNTRYNYKPFFDYFNVYGEISNSRSSFYLQEYERDEFLY